MPSKSLPGIGAFRVDPKTGMHTPYFSGGNLEVIHYDDSLPYRQISDVRGNIRRVFSFNSCRHIKCITPGEFTYNGEVCHGSLTGLVDTTAIYSKAISKAYLQLDFQENNNFELIPFLADWDATLLMFSRKFLKEISYGALTWGVLPFISDVKSLIASLQDIYGGMQASYEKIVGKRISRRCRFQFILTHSEFEYDVIGTVNYSGYVTGQILPDNLFDSILVLLDEIGLHPDLKTIWDVIPLSFVADYFAPVGDALESIHPRGWFRPSFEISGGHSIKASISMRGRSAFQGNCGSYTLYDRRPGVLNLPSRPPVDPSFKAPGLKEIFNTGYLGLSTRNKR